MKTFAFFPIFALVLFTATPTFAQVSITPSQTPPTFRQKRETARELRFEIKERLEQKKTELKEKAQKLAAEVRTTRARATAAKIRARLVARFEFLTKMKSALETKISRLEATNVTAEKKRDLTAAKAALAKFDATKYQATLVSFDAVVAKISLTDMPSSLLPEINQAAKGINTELKSLHETLVTTIKAIAQSRK